MSKVATLVAEIDRKAEEQSAIFTEADEKSEGELTAEQTASIKALGDEIKTLEAKALALQEQETLRGGVETRLATRDERSMRHSGTQNPERKDDQPQRRQIVSLGEQFLESEEFKDWYTRTAGKSNSFGKTGIQSPKIEVKDIITGADVTSGGALVWPDVRPGLTLLGRRPLVMRDIVTVGTTGSDLIEYARVVAENNRASGIPEATNAYDDNGLKPESDFELEKVQAPVKTIAHMVTTTTRALSDAGQLRTMIDGFLRDGVAQALEDEMVTGDGSGEHFEGLEVIPGVQDQAFVDSNLKTTRRARTKVRTIGRAIATAYLMHPNDWETLDLTMDGENRYYFGGPREMGIPRLWGLPVVESEACEEGVAYVGDFRTLVLWDREQASIQVSNSHKDYFQKNLVAVLGEMRAAFGALRPSAIVRVALAVGS